MEDDALDRLLRSLPLEQPTAALLSAVIASAPRPRSQVRFWRAWGAGWAVAGVAGLLVGASLNVDVRSDDLLAELEPYDAIAAFEVEDRS